jgi:hypothetical protein
MDKQDAGAAWQADTLRNNKDYYELVIEFYRVQKNCDNGVKDKCEKKSFKGRPESDAF